MSRLLSLLAAILLTATAALAQPAADPPPPEIKPGALPAPSPLQPGDAFGEQVELQEMTVIYMNGQAAWGSAAETLIETFKSLQQYLDKQGLKADGPPMTIYTQTDDTGFQFRAAIPVKSPPADPPKGDFAVGKSPSGKALKFVHRGTYDAMDTTYEAITNYLDDKQLEAKDLFVEEYPNGPMKTPDDKLVVNIYVPIK